MQDDDDYIPFEGLRTGRPTGTRALTGEEAKPRIEAAKRSLEKIREHQKKS